MPKVSNVPKLKAFKCSIPSVPSVYRTQTEPKIKDMHKLEIEKDKFKHEIELKIEAQELLEKNKNKKLEEIRKKKREINNLYKDIREIDEVLREMKHFKMIEYY